MRLACLQQPALQLTAEARPLAPALEAAAPCAAFHAAPSAGALSGPPSLREGRFGGSGALLSAPSPHPFALCSDTYTASIDEAIPAHNVGYKLLERMGWRAGAGLGRELQGVGGAWAAGSCRAWKGGGLPLKALAAAPPRLECAVMEGGQLYPASTGCQAAVLECPCTLRRHCVCALRRHCRAGACGHDRQWHTAGAGPAGAGAAVHRCRWAAAGPRPARQLQAAARLPWKPARRGASAWRAL